MEGQATPQATPRTEDITIQGNCEPAMQAGFVVVMENLEVPKAEQLGDVFVAVPVPDSPRGVVQELVEYEKRLAHRDLSKKLNQLHGDPNDTTVKPTSFKVRNASAYKPHKDVEEISVDEAPAYYTELQRAASIRRTASRINSAHAHKGRAGSAATCGEDQLAPLPTLSKRLESLGARVLSSMSRVSSMGVSPQALQFRTVKNLIKFPMLSNDMANTLQGYERCETTAEVRRVDQGPLWKMILIPFISFLPVFLYAIPTSWGKEAKKSGEIWETWILWGPILVFTTALFPLWIGSWSEIEYRSKRIFFIYFGITWGIVGSVVTLSPLWASDIIAVPFVKIIQAGIFLIYLGLSVVFGMNPEQRKEKKVFKRAAIGLVVSMSVIVMFAFIYPLINILFLRASTSLVQFCIAVLFWFLSFVYVGVLNKAAKSQRPDMYPVIAYLSVFFYNFFLSSVFSVVQSPYVFATFLFLDIGESFYFSYVASGAVTDILDSEAEAEAADRQCAIPNAMGIIVSSVPNETETETDQAPGVDRIRGLHVKIVNRCLCALSLPVTKLLAAVLAPLEYLASLFLLRAANPKMNGAFTFLSDDQIKLTVIYICVQVLVEGLLFLLLRLWVKRRSGIDMWLIARGVCHLFFFEIIACQWTAMLCYLALQWAPGGVDWSFKFNYLRDDATWQGGMCWTLPGQNMTDLVQCGGALH